MAAERERGKGGQEIATLQQQVQQLQRVLGEQGENQLRIEDELSAAADDKGALQRLDAQLAEQAHPHPHPHPHPPPHPRPHPRPHPSPSPQP